MYTCDSCGESIKDNEVHDAETACNDGSECFLNSVYYDDTGLLFSIKITSEEGRQYHYHETCLLRLLKQSIDNVEGKTPEELRKSVNPL